MRHTADNDEVQQLRSQLRLQIDAAAKSLAAVFHTAADLLIEIAQQQTTIEPPNPVETKPTPSMLTPEQAADYLGVKPQTLAVWRSTARYAVPFVRVGRLVRYRKADLDRFLDRRAENRRGDADSP
jgi:excisionase family DNA binding protein